jgi:hypothetical protein
MKIEVGTEYKCGDEIVKIIHIHVFEYLASTCALAFGIACKSNAENPYSGMSETGVFSLQGLLSGGNPECLQHDLEKIKEAKELTVKEIEGELGYEVKVVK